MELLESTCGKGMRWDEEGGGGGASNTVHIENRPTGRNSTNEMEMLAHSYSLRVLCRSLSPVYRQRCPCLIGRVAESTTIRNPGYKYYV